MATISFSQNVVIKDQNKADEVKRAMDSNMHSCSEIPPAKIDFEKQKDDAEKWCSLLKK